VCCVGDLPLSLEMQVRAGLASGDSCFDLCQLLLRVVQQLVLFVVLVLCWLEWVPQLECRGDLRRGGALPTAHCGVSQDEADPWRALDALRGGGGAKAAKKRRRRQGGLAGEAAVGRAVIGAVRKLMGGAGDPAAVIMKFFGARAAEGGVSEEEEDESESAAPPGVQASGAEEASTLQRRHDAVAASISSLLAVGTGSDTEVMKSLSAERDRLRSRLAVQRDRAPGSSTPSGSSSSTSQQPAPKSSQQPQSQSSQQPLQQKSGQQQQPQQPRPQQTFYHQLIRKAAGDAAGPKALSRVPRLLPGQWRKIVLIDELLVDLEAGRAPRGEVAAGTREQVEMARNLAQAHKIDAAFTLVYFDVENDAEALEGSATGLVSTDVGVRTAWKIGLGSRVAVPAQCPPKQVRLSEPIAAQIAAKLPGDVVKVRCTMPRQFAGAEWDKRKAAPQKAAVQQLGKLTLDDVKCEGWRVDSYRSTEKVTGLLLLRSDDEAKRVLSMSGKNGIFYEKLGVQHPIVEWLTRSTTDEADSEYLARCLAAAEGAGHPLAFRCGGDVTLGFRLDSELVRRWVVQGVPASWGPATLTAVLEAASWKRMSSLRPPAHRGQSWRIAASAPEGDDAVTEFAIAVSSSIQLSVRPWYPAAGKGGRDSTAVSGARWVPAHAAEVVSSSSRRGTRKAPTAEAPAARPQGTENGEQAEGGEVDMQDDSEQGRKRARAAAGPAAASQGTASASAAASASPAPVVLEDAELKGPSGCLLVSLGGSGDCGFRAVAAAVAELNGGSRDDIRRTLPALVTTARVKAVAHLRSTFDAWSAEWQPSALATRSTEDGDVAMTAKEWLQVVESRPRRWVCARVLCALSAAYEVDILVWSKRDGKWSLETRCEAGAKKGRAAIAVALADNHYFWIPHAAITTSWRTRAPRVKIPGSWDGRGGARSAASGISCGTSELVRRLSRPIGRSSAAGSTPRSEEAESASCRRASASSRASSVAAASRSAPGTATRLAKTVRTAGAQEAADYEEMPMRGVDARAEAIRSGAYFRCAECSWQPDFGCVADSVEARLKEGGKQTRAHWREQHGKRPPPPANYQLATGFKGSAKQVQTTQERSVRQFTEWVEKYKGTIVEDGMCKVDVDGPALYCSQKQWRVWPCQWCGKEKVLSHIRQHPCAAWSKRDAEKVKAWHIGMMGAAAYRKWEKKRKAAAASCHARKMAADPEGYKAKRTTWMRQHRQQNRDECNAKKRAYMKRVYPKKKDELNRKRRKYEKDNYHRFKERINAANKKHYWKKKAATGRTAS
jgi:hypothetical protein